MTSMKLVTMNLEEILMINLMVDNKRVEIDWTEFSDGAITCKVGCIPKPAKNLSISVHPRIKASLVLEYLELLIDALAQEEVWVTETSGSTANLRLPYLPYARADRVFEKGNPNGLQVFMNRLSGLGFDSVHVCDPHNESALTHNIKWEVKDQLSCYRDSYGFDFDRNQYDYVVAPDKGAVDKAKSIANFLRVPLVCASKERCIKTGKIINTTFNAELPSGANVLVVDDICDGGGTFIPLGAEILSQGCTADIYWTHLIGSRGLEIFRGIYNKIYYYQTVGTYLTDCDVIHYNQKLL
jgi:ribose-phosphate pyrophosphokinase